MKKLLKLADVDSWTDDENREQLMRGGFRREQAEYHLRRPKACLEEGVACWSGGNTESVLPISSGKATRKTAGRR